MKVRIVKNRNYYGHVHREDCLSKGYSTNCDRWTEDPVEVSDMGFPLTLPNQEEADILVDRADEEDVRFCNRCLPHLALIHARRRQRRSLAYRLGVTP